MAGNWPDVAPPRRRQHHRDTNNMQNNHILLLVRASRYTSGKEEQSCKCSEFSIAKLGCGSASPQHQARHPWGSAMTLKGSILIKKLFRRLTRLGVGMGSTDAVQPVPLLIAMRSGELSTAIGRPATTTGDTLSPFTDFPNANSYIFSMSRATSLHAARASSKQRIVVASVYRHPP